jgi:hypothetical protein
MRRTLWPLAAVALLAVIVGGCGNGSAGTGSSASAAAGTGRSNSNSTATAREKAVKFAELLRRNSWASTGPTLISGSGWAASGSASRAS